MHRRTGLSLLSVALLLSIAPTPGFCGDSRDLNCCAPPAKCGGGGVCKLVCTTRVLETVCYGCECEDVCVPGPSRRCCTTCQQACDCDCRSMFVWSKWIPGCAKLFHRKRLKKYLVTKEVPSYKWIVVPACRCGCASDITKPAPPGSQLGDELPATDKEIASLTSARRATPRSSEQTAR